MAKSALEQIRELEKQKQALVVQAANEALTAASASVKELKELLFECLKVRAGSTPQ